jgi:hypothetical protein
MYKSPEIAFSVNLRSLKFQSQFQCRSTLSLVSEEICSFQAPAPVAQDCTLLELGEVHPYQTKTCIDYRSTCTGPSSDAKFFTDSTSHIS